MVGMCPCKTTKSDSSSSSLFFPNKRTSNQAIFLRPASTKTRTGGKVFSYFSQAMGNAIWDPYGTVHLAPTKSPHIKPPFNAITPTHAQSTSSAHTSNLKPIHPYSYVIPIKPPLQKLLPTPSTQPQQPFLHTNNLNKTPKTNHSSIFIYIEPGLIQ